MQDVFNGRSAAGLSFHFVVGTARSPARSTGLKFKTDCN